MDFMDSNEDMLPLGVRHKFEVQPKLQKNLMKNLLIHLIDKAFIFSELLQI